MEKPSKKTTSSFKHAAQSKENIYAFLVLLLLSLFFCYYKESFDAFFALCSMLKSTTFCHFFVKYNLLSIYA